MKTLFILITTTIITTYTHGQALGVPPSPNTNDRALAAWYRGGNTPIGTSVPGANRLGTRWNSDIWLMTNSNDMGRFTQGDALFGLNANGDGLELINRQPSTGPAGIGNIAIFTSPGFTNGTEIRMGLSGNIRGANNRFEIWGRYQGLYFNTPEAVSRTKFAHGGTVTGLIGENNYWLIGLQSDASNLNGVRRLHVFDTQAQFRLSFGGQNQSTGLFTDFLSNNAGNLQIMPSNGRVGINLNANPTANLDVNGDARIRNVPTAAPDALFVGVQAGGANDMNVRRLDFSGNANDVLLGDGTWGAAPVGGTVNAAQNGTWITGGSIVEWGTMPLIHDTEIPMNTRDILFQTFPTAEGTFTLGGNNYVTDARMRINNDYELGGSYYNKGLDVRSTTAGFMPIKTGIQSIANNAGRLTSILGTAQTGTNVTGVQGTALNGTENTFGVVGIGSSNSTSGRAYGGRFVGTSPTVNENYGVYGEGGNSIKTNYGGYFIGQGGSLAIGVYGEGITNAGTSFGGYFVGNIVTQGGSIPSDAQFKTNVADMNNANAVLDALNPVTYEYAQTGNAQYMSFPQGNQFGLIAQEVEQILPELVDDVSHPQRVDSLGNIVVPSFDYKTVKYQELIPILIAGHQEQQAIIQQQAALITDLNDRLTQLENCLANILPSLCNANNNAIQQTPEQTQQELRSIIDVELRKGTSIVLDQNVPNPFAERTVIMYSIPSTVGKAQMHFYNGSGELINTVDINERGDGQLNVFASDLSSGVYTYSLVADGKVVATRRMVKQ